MNFTWVLCILLFWKPFPWVNITIALLYFSYVASFKIFNYSNSCSRFFLGSLLTFKKISFRLKELLVSRVSCRNWLIHGGYMAHTRTILSSVLGIYNFDQGVVETKLQTFHKGSWCVLLPSFPGFCFYNCCFDAGRYPDIFSYIPFFWLKTGQVNFCCLQLKDY